MDKPQNQGSPKEYVIEWENSNPDRNRRGRGHTRYTQERAEELAAELNADYPWITHKAVRAE